MPEQDDHHEPGSHNPEEGSDLKLLEEIFRLQERRAPLRVERITRPDEQDEQDEAGRKDHGFVVGPEAQASWRDNRVGGSAHRNTSSLFLRRSSLSPPMLTAARSTSPSKRGCRRGATSKMRKLNEIVRSTIAPIMDPMALPVPPRSDVPPMTTAAMEFSV